MCNSRRSQTIACAGVCLGLLTLSTNRALAAGDDNSSPARTNVIGDTNIPTIEPPGELDPLMAKALRDAEDLLDKGDRQCRAVLVYRVATRDAKIVKFESQMMTVGASGTKPGTGLSGEPVVACRAVHRDAAGVELVLRADGYRDFRRTGVLRENQVTIWDDIELSDLLQEGVGLIKGIILLEDKGDVSDVKVLLRGHSVTTDNEGRFEFKDVPPGENRISASIRGYVGLYTRVEVKPKNEHTVELRGYWPRFARVRWAYQPDGSRNLSKSVQQGTALVDSTQLSRIGFEAGFKNVMGKSDFGVRQDGDKLMLSLIDGRANQAFAALKDTKFDDVQSVPENVLFSNKAVTLEPGHTYIIRTFDGKHYAKLEVLELIDAAEELSK